MDKTIKIVPVSKNDKSGKLIMEWRNDPITRKMFFNGNIKMWDDFKIEFHQHYFKNIPLFAEFDNQKIAFVSFVRYNDHNDENTTYSISININPQFRGKGYASKIIDESIKYIVENHPDIKKVIAEVKKENIPSHKTFIKSNFIWINDYEKDIDNVKVCISKYEFNIHDK